MEQKLSSVAKTFTPSAIQELSHLAQRSNAINLAEGFPDFSAPSHLKNAAISAINSDFNQYRWLPFQFSGRFFLFLGNTNRESLAVLWIKACARNLWPLGEYYEGNAWFRFWSSDWYGYLLWPNRGICSRSVC